MTKTITGYGCKIVRKTLGISKKCLAETCSLSEPTITRYESGNYSAHPTTTFLISNALDTAIRNSRLDESVKEQLLDTYFN